MFPVSYRLLIGAAAVAAAAAGALLLPGRSSAESRLFSVRTDQPAVTIVQATRGGKDLSVAGQNAGQTFFRIDNPAGAVPCVNSIRFVASNGQAVDDAVDLCANNWDLTISVGSAAAGQSSQGQASSQGQSSSQSQSQSAAQAAAPAVPVAPLPAAPGTVRPVAIATDDPHVTISTVYLDGQPAPVAARQDPYVQVNLVAGPQGFACNRDIGLSLSDGRRIARSVNVCSTNFVVFIPLVGGVAQPPLPPSMRGTATATIRPLPPAPAQQPSQNLPAQNPPPASGPQIVTSLQWAFAGNASQAVLAFGAVGNATGEFSASCQPGTGRATITLGRTAGELGPTGKVWVTFTAGAFSKAYSAIGGAVSATDNLSHPMVTVTVGDPLWAPLVTEKTVLIAVGSTPTYGLSLSGSATPVRQFLAVCSPAPPPQQVQSLPPFQGQPPTFGEPPAFGEAPFAGRQPPSIQPVSPRAADVLFQCDDGSYVSATFGAASAIVYEPGYPPLMLPEVPFRGDGRRFAAGPSQLVGEGEGIYWTRDGGDGRSCRRG